MLIRFQIALMERFLNKLDIKYNQFTTFQKKLEPVVIKSIVIIRFFFLTFNRHFFQYF